MRKPANVYAPVWRPAARKKTAKAKKEPVFTLEFFVCFFSFTMLLYSSVAGTWAIVGFLAPWPLIIMKRFFSIPQVLRKSWPLLLLPGWSIISVLWSIEPAWTFRSSLEFTGTVMVGILAAYCVKPRIVIAALLLSFMVIACVCMAKSGTVAAIAADAPINGIFGSKNFFSSIICSLLLISVAVAADKNQMLLFRLIGVAGVALSPFLLFFGRSMDAILSGCFTLIIFLAVRLLARVDHKIRLVAVIFIILIGLSLILILSLVEFNPNSLLNAVGKDSTLTGRTHLWNRAFDFIAERPILGVGYNAFWRITNMHARELWYDSKVPMGAGFNFHNEYIDAWVGSGVVGFGLIVGYLFIVSKRVMKGILGSMNAEQYFALLMFVYLFIRTPVESEIFGVFSINMILYCLIWHYFQLPKPLPPKPFSLPSKGAIR